MKTDFETLATKEGFAQKYEHTNWSSSLVWDQFVGLEFETNCKDSNQTIANAKGSLLKEMLEMNHVKRISLGKVIDRLNELETMEQVSTAQPQQEEQDDD